MFQIGELEETKIRVTMTVVGCPLTFQMTAAQPDLKPVVRSVPYFNSVIVYVFQIGELEETNIPVTMTVVGCPLTFQMTAAQPDLKPVVRSVPYFNSVIVYIVSDRRT